MITLKKIIAELEKWAPLSYQESYDNAGLLTGSPSWEAKGVLLTLDVTEEVVAEAVRKGANLIVAHHPILFKGLRRLNGSNYVERTVIEAIKNDVAIYAIHTNLDNVATGVNRKIAEKIGLSGIKVLAPKTDELAKLSFFVPVAHTQSVLDALFAAGAGTIGAYSECSFRVEGIGTFRPGTEANPHIGEKDQLESVVENRVEVMFPAFLQHKVLAALRQAHPYEEVAYYLQSLLNTNQEVGAGAVGELPVEMEAADFLALLKDRMNLKVIKHTHPIPQKIKRVAVCGGSGSFLLKNAIGAGADVFVTSDFKYHEFFDAENRLMICDIGHYESEVFTKDLLFSYLSEKFDNFALYLSEVNTNPVTYHV
jgi:dinuclear metal center YbgI/SA1388 family protein